MPSKDELKLYQAYSLDMKIWKTQQRIREWVQYYGVDGVYVSFSGGKDSTVLLHIVRQLYPEVEAVFVNTGLEYPELQRFAKSFENVSVFRPEMRFDEVIRKYGYPFIRKEVAECIYQGKMALLDGERYIYRLQKLQGRALDKNGNKSMFNMEKYEPLLYVDFNISHHCCNVMKKKPLHAFSKENSKMPITAQLAEESNLRKQQWIRNGCNGFEMKSPISNPMSFWKEQDVLQYIKENNIPIASVYGEVVELGKNGQSCMQGCGKLCTTGCDRTGCIFCAFGANRDCDNGGESRFERLKKTHPKQYEYCMGGGSYQWDGYVNKNGKWKKLSFKGKDGTYWSDKNIDKFVQKHKDDKNYKFERLWKPNKDGLGMAHCIDEINKIYGKDFIKY